MTDNDLDVIQERLEHVLTRYDGRDLDPNDPALRAVMRDAVKHLEARTLDSVGRCALSLARELAKRGEALPFGAVLAAAFPSAHDPHRIEAANHLVQIFGAVATLWIHPRPEPLATAADIARAADAIEDAAGMIADIAALLRAIAAPHGIARTRGAA